MNASDLGRSLGDAELSVAILRGERQLSKTSSMTMLMGLYGKTINRSTAYQAAAAPVTLPREVT